MRMRREIRGSKFILSWVRRTETDKADMSANIWITTLIHPELALNTDKSHLSAEQVRCNQNVLIYQYQLFIVFPRKAKTHSWCRWMWLDSSWYVLHIKSHLTIVLIVTPVFVLWRRRGPAWGGAPLWTNYSQSYCYQHKAPLNPPN